MEYISQEKKSQISLIFLEKYGYLLDKIVWSLNISLWVYILIIEEKSVDPFLFCLFLYHVLVYSFKYF